MNIISYLNDPYSIDQTLKHLIDLFTENSAALKKQISKQKILRLRFGELDTNGKFLELKIPKAFKKKYSTPKKLTSELLFFDVLAQQEEYKKPLTQLTEAITDYNRHNAPLWSDTSSFMGINILIPLAIKDAKNIPALIHFLSSTQLKNEITLSEDLNRVFQEHGWINETLDLLAARATILEGTHGKQHIKELLTEYGLSGFLQKSQHQNVLLEKLTEYALLNYAEHAGQISPEDIISYATNPFKNVCESLKHKSKFLHQSFVEHFPNYLPYKHQLFSNHGQR